MDVSRTRDKSFLLLRECIEYHHSILISSLSYMYTHIQSGQRRLLRVVSEYYEGIYMSSYINELNICIRRI